MIPAWCLSEENEWVESLAGRQHTTSWSWCRKTLSLKVHWVGFSVLETSLLLECWCLQTISWTPENEVPRPCWKGKLPNLGTKASCFSVNFPMNLFHMIISNPADFFLNKTMYLTSSQKQEHMYLKVGSQFLIRCFFKRPKPRLRIVFKKTPTEITWSGPWRFCSANPSPLDDGRRSDHENLPLPKNPTVCPTGKGIEPIESYSRGLGT